MSPDTNEEILEIVRRIEQQIQVPNALEGASAGLSIGSVTKGLSEATGDLGDAVGVPDPGKSIANFLGIGGAVVPGLGDALDKALEGIVDILADGAGKLVEAFVEALKTLDEGIIAELLEALSTAVRRGAGAAGLKVIFLDLLKEIFKIAENSPAFEVVVAVAESFSRIVAGLIESDGLQKVIAGLVDDVAAAIKGFLSLDELATSLKVAVPRLAEGIEALHGNAAFNEGLAGAAAPLARALDLLFVKVDDDGNVTPAPFTNAVAGTATILARPVQVLLEKLLEVVNDGLLVNAVLDNFPCGLGARAQGSLQLLLDWKAIAVELDLFTRAEARLNAVIKSLEALAEIAAGAEGEVHLFSLTRITGTLTAMVKAVLELNVNAPPDVLAQLVLNLLKDLVIPIDALVALLKAVMEGKFAAWARMPCGIAAGGMHAWVNSCATFQGDMALEREFRLGLMSALDAFISAKMKSDKTVQDGAFAVDGQLVSELAAELIGVLFAEIVSFVLLPKCLPSIEAEVESFEDIGGRLAVLQSKQQKMAVRAAIGMSLRGVWEWSLHNEALIELVGSAVASAFSSINFGVAQNISGTFKLSLVYREDHVPGIAIDRWPSLEEADCGSIDTSPLEYVLTVRNPSVTLTEDEIDDLKAAFRETSVEGLAYDYGAYLEMAYAAYPGRILFPAIRKKGAFDFAEAQYIRNQDRLVIHAEPSSRGDSPRTVVRVYFGCARYVLDPPKDPGSGTWEREFSDLDRVPSAVHLLSSDGGEAIVDVVEI